MKLDYFLSWVTQSLLVVAFVSGLPLVFFYYPNNAFDSVQKISNIIPYGLFIRKLHYFSSEAAVIFLFLHTVYELILSKRPKERINFLYASLAFMSVLLLLYTGYVLKADQSGRAAALVGENILKDSYILHYFSSFVIDKDFFYWRFFLWHILFLPMLLFYLVFLHIKKIMPNISFIVIGLGLSIIVLYLIQIPSDIPFSYTVYHLKGPWFFQGIENMLKLNFPVDLSLFLGIFPFFVLSVYLYIYNQKKILHILLIIWIIYYTFITLKI